MEWALDAAGGPCTEEIAEEIVEAIDRMGLRWEKVGGYWTVPAVGRWPQEKWLALLTACAQRVERRARRKA
ncbi:MAG: hypothetical protein C4292_02415 [Nitrososphaera sp.]